ncbi:MAG: isocitrate/isopropylmalate family dehydrogenase [Pseudomonadota bacterium]
MRLLILPGDGIGPEITQATRTVLETADARYSLGLQLEERVIGWQAYNQHGTTLPDGVLERARAVDGIVLGPISHLDYPARGQGGVNVSAAIRVGLDLFANTRPARTRLGLPHRGSEMDLVIVREATEGFYPDRNMVAGSGEFMPTADVALSMRKITRPACRRIAEVAFAMARKRRQKVTAVHKANNFILTDGLFLEEVRAAAQRYPEVALEEEIVDAMAAKLVRDASRYDVICATNFHGDILSDLAAELAGGLGLGGAINAGTALVCAQAQHGSAPDIAGQDKANPGALMQSVAMMLAWLAERHDWPAGQEASAAIEQALDQAVSRRETRTADLGGTLSTSAFACLVARLIRDGV